jgi:16S rRNA (cytosine967-C5)-methyltransferase
MNKRPTLTLKSKPAPATKKPAARKPAAPNPAAAQGAPAQRQAAAPKAAQKGGPSAGPKAPPKTGPQSRPAPAAGAPQRSPWESGRARPSASPATQPPARAQSEPGLRASHHRDLKPRVQTEFQAELRPDSLAFALLGAATAVVQVRGGMALPQALAGVFANAAATPQARGAIQDVAYRAMRQLGRSEALVAAMAPKAPDPLVAALLACALPLMQAGEDGPAPYEAFTVVDQAVTAAGAHPDTVRAKGMVNALLRRFLRERDTLLESVCQQPPARWNYPQWWIDAAITAYPQDWQAVLATGNRAPPLTLRVNTRKGTVDDYLRLLAGAGIGARQVGPQAVRLDKPVGVHQIPGFAEGLVSVQDAGAQLAAPLLDVKAGMRVLEACAAPGGKTGHLLELADVDLTALDADAQRLARVGENLDRLGLSATLRPAQAQARDWWDGRQFDRILADVPCTASGIVRRHPDIRWLRRKSDTLQLATLSAQILDNLWQMLLPNGKLLFVTCSLWPQESEAQAAAFAVRNRATRLDAPGQLLPVGGAEQDHDGLFYALFQKDA